MQLGMLFVKNWSSPKDLLPDVAICKTDSIVQGPENIIAIFEVKMSVVWNWELFNIGSKHSLKCVGDFRTHRGNPGLLRSDSILKAIGKSTIVKNFFFRIGKNTNNCFR